MIYAILALFNIMTLAERHEIAALACSYNSLGFVIIRGKEHELYRERWGK